MGTDDELRRLRRADPEGLEEQLALLHARARTVSVEERGVWTSALGEALLGLDEWEATEALSEGADPSLLSGAAVHAACRSASADFLALLCATGLDLNGRNRLGWTPLSVERERERIVLLFDLGGRIEVGTTDRFSDGELDGGDGETALHVACERGWADLIPGLLAAGGDRCLAVADYVGRTPLHCAVRAGRVPAVRALLRPELVSSFEWDREHPEESALADAIRLGHLGAVELIAPLFSRRAELVPFCQAHLARALRPERRAALRAALSALQKR